MCVCVSPAKDYSSRMGRTGGNPTYLNLFGSVGSGTTAACKRRDRNISVRNDLMGGMTTVEHLWSSREEMTPLFCCSESLFSPKQMIFIKGWTAVVGFPSLKTRREIKRGENRSKDFSHLLLQYYCFTDESLRNLKVLEDLSFEHLTI